MTHTPAPWTPYDREDAIPVPSAWAGIPDDAYHADQMARPHASSTQTGPPPSTGSTPTPPRLPGR